MADVIAEEERQTGGTSMPRSPPIGYPGINCSRQLHEGCEWPSLCEVSDATVAEIDDIGKEVLVNRIADRLVEAVGASV